MEIESKSTLYYWIIIIILILALCWSKYRSRNRNNTEIIHENFESQETNLEFNELLGLLLDNQTIANQIIIDNPKINSISSLANLNQDRTRLKLKPPLNNTQFQIVLRYLLLRDVYFIDIDPYEFINYAKNTQILNPIQLYKSSSVRETQLNKFRQKYHLEKDKYLKYNWILDKIQTFITQYGLRKVTKSFANLTEIFDNYWEGQKQLTKRDFSSFEPYTVIYSQKSQTYYIKIKDNQWYLWSESNIKLIQKIQHDNFDMWFDIINQATQNPDKTLEKVPDNDSYIWIRSPSIMSLQQLYRKIDELDNDNYFQLTPYYDQLINLNNNLNKLQRSKLLKTWIEKKTNNQKYQKIIIENIILDLNQQVIQIFDDLCVYLIFFQYDSIMDLHLNLQNISLDQWWSSPTLDELLIRSTKLDQCYLPAKFSMRQVQDSPPLFKYLFNNNLYHTFWEPLEIYINQLEDTLKNTFRTSDVYQLAPIARFCIFNNPSFREFIAKYIHCTKDKCSNIDLLSEPEKCGQLKLKYQELLSLKQKYICLYNSKTSANPLNTTNKKETFLSLQDNPELTPKINQDDSKIDQMFGFGKTLLLDIVQYALKLHKCDTTNNQNIKIENCQDLVPHIDVEDQSTDQNLGKVEIDRQPDMYSVYDQQLEQYHKILHDKEVKTLTPLNTLANKDIKDKIKNTSIQNNILRNAADDFYSIISDLTNLSIYSTEKNNEDFNNLLEDNQDLLESTSTSEYDADYTSKIKNGLPNVQKIMFDIWHILTKDGRMMTSGFIIIIISFALYFIDITS
uniref:Uncharacterized protein n=1 Tax=viral metagenome TaxID=1070528 RepID=A0A6C0E5S0_9ZZZZ